MPREIARRGLAPDSFNRFCWRPYEREPRVSDSSRERCALGEEPVSGVHSRGPRAVRSFD